LRPTTSHLYSPPQLVLGQEPDISYLRTFGCVVQVPVAPSQRTKMGPQRRLGIYVGFDSPSIIWFLEPLTGDLFTARFADCHFDETVFPSLGIPKASIYGKQKNVEIFSWNEKSLSHLDPRTPECENEVQRLIHLQAIANQMPDAFNETTKVTKSHILVANVPAKIDVLVEPPEMDLNGPRLNVVDRWDQKTLFLKKEGGGI